MRVFFLLICTVLISFFSYSRDYKKYDRALKLFEQNKYSKSKKILFKILENDNDWDSPNLLLARILFIEGNVLKSLEYMLIAYDENNAEDKDGLELIAKLYFQNGYYHKALKYFQLVSDFDKGDIDPKIKLYKEKCIYSIENIGDSVAVELYNLGSNINSLYEEYLPAVSVDGKTMVFSRRVKEPDDYIQEDFYLSVKDTNGDWQPSVLYPGSINTLGNEGAFSFSPNKELVVFTACNRQDGEGRCDLYIFYDDKVFNAGKIINTKYWESQACFSPDGNYLYFVSNRPGGYGGTDIWISEITKNGFAPAYNAGPVINTKKDEMSPFIHADNLNLYFSSKGHVGMGDYDLFLSNRDSITSKWKKPKNIGYPINDHKSQNSMIVSSDGKTAYFNSSFEGYGSDDIFYFDLPNNIQATPLNNIELDIIVSKIGEEIILKNVHFSNNSYVLNDSSKIELNKLSDYLINYKIKIKIEGHTDSNGDSNLNLVLSNNRAKSVNDYLISNGVEQNQLNFSGYGDSRPIADNNSKEGRAINRRTSFIIID